jgi:phosphatidylserine/phosphatidylglycerophosphate/cardiolipin synthase-like enzyme
MHDVHCRIEGPAVNHMVDVFVQRWLAHPDHGKLDKDRGALRGLADRVPTGRAPGTPG